NLVRGHPGGDEKGEPLDYFAYYDEGVVVPDRREGNEQNLEVGEQSGGGGGGGGTKRKLDLEEAEEGEFQLMPTSTATHSPDGVSPPKKIPRGPLPRSVVWGVPDDKPKKQRSSPIISSVRQEQQAMRFQVSSLADELSRKLQFLHVSSDGVSDMQILQVEVKTTPTTRKTGFSNWSTVNHSLSSPNNDFIASSTRDVTGPHPNDYIAIICCHGNQETVKSAALPHQVTRALVTPEMKQLAKVAAATAKKKERNRKRMWPRLLEHFSREGRWSGSYGGFIF
ncbi:hypothetical protein GBAR_LOCUS4662, partial [Geodia barretti]